MKPKGFFGELKRRNVYKVAVAYAIVGWLVMQVASTVVPALHLPDTITSAVVVLTLLGFPVALVLAWAFELTPEGIKRAGDVDGSARDASTNRIWVYVAVIGAALSVGLFFVGRYTAGNTTPGHNASPAPTEATTASAQKSIAVLPLLNESGDPKDEYFSDGLSEELIAALAQIRDLKVIGRSSSFRFKDRKEEPKTIGEKLGVATLLEGTVRKQGDRVRIVAELVNAADGIELWTRTFDRELKDIFAVQQEIARAVAESLRVTLLGSEEKSTQMATNSVEAHNAYLQAHFHFQRRNVEDYRKAITYFDRAIELDPNYAVVYAERSEAWTIIGDLTGQRSTAYPKARSDAEKAVAIAPALAEAHAALGWVRSFAEWKFAEGLSELQRAKELSPANPTCERFARASNRLQGPNGRSRTTGAARRWRSILCLLQRNSPLGESFSTRANLTRQTRLGAKWQSCSRPHLPVIDGKCLSPSSAAMARRPYAKRNWSLMRAFAPFELALAQYIRGDSKASDAALADLIANSGIVSPIKSPKFTPCGTRQTKHSSGCKSHLIITTAACRVF